MGQHGAQMDDNTKEKAQQPAIKSPVTEEKSTLDRTGRNEESSALCPYAGASSVPGGQPPAYARDDGSLVDDAQQQQQQHQQQQPPPRRLLGFLYLHPTFSPLNLLSYLMAALFTVCFFVFINSETAFVLKEILGLKEGEGMASGALSVSDELMSMVAALLWGAASDRIGRRSVYTTSFVLMGAALAVYPLAQNLWPQLILARLLFAIGGAGASSMLTAVLADCAGKLRGRISGLVGLMSGLGALLGVFVLLPLPTKFLDSGIPLGRGTQYAFFTTAGIAGVFALFFWATAAKSFGGRKSGAETSSGIHTTSNATGNGSAVAAPTATGLKGVLSSCKEVAAHSLTGLRAAKDLRIATAYAAGFSARGNTIVITLFLPLWVYKFYVDNGLCQVSGLDPNNSEVIKENCRQAFTRSAILGGVTQTFALIGAPIWGLLIDRFGTTDRLDDENPAVARPPGRFQYSTLPLLATCVLAAIGYALLAIVTDPRKGVLMAVAVLVGVGEIGTVIVSAAMVAAAHISVADRGAISGAYAMCGGLGIMFATAAGGALFDTGALTAPFALMSGVHVVVALLAAVGLVVDVRARRMAAAVPTSASA